MQRDGYRCLSVSLVSRKTVWIKNERNINKALNIVASENRYHPIRKYLEQLAWDGKYRIGKLLPKYLGAEDDAYTKEIMQLLMLAAIHRIYEPGCKYEIMVCLVGGQGAGKSTFSDSLQSMINGFRTI